MAARLTGYFHPLPAHAHALHATHVHPHAHQIGFAAALIGLIGIPLGPMVVPSMVAIVLGTMAVLLSIHPAPGMNARPEGWVGIATGILGLIFGLVQVLVQMNL
jgi:hypothetical protein